MLFGSSFGATLEGLTVVKGTSEVKGTMSNFDAKKGANRQRAETYFGSRSSTNQRLLQRETTEGTY